MELEGIMLSEVSQGEKDKYQMISLTSREGGPKETEWAKQHQIHRTQEWTNSYQRERNRGG